MPDMTNEEIEQFLRDRGCEWTDTPGTRSISHIENCPACAEVWPQIAENPEQAKSEAVRMFMERIMRDIGELP